MDEQAFKTCFEASRAPLMAYLWRASGNATLAEDLLQEAYLRLLDRPPRDQRPEALRSWLFTTATRLLRDHWRQNRRWGWWPWGGTGADADGPTEPPSSERSPDELAQDHQRVALGFAALGPRERSLLWLLHVEGMNHAEAAQALGLRAASVRVLAHRARHRMRAALAELESLPPGGVP